MIPKGYRALIPLAISALIVTCCGGGGPPTHLLRLTQESLQNRAIQTRMYKGISESDLHAAATGVIQDLGFIVDESEPKLGLIVGSKDRDAPPDATQRVGQVIAGVGAAAFSLLAIIGGNLEAAGKAFDLALMWVDDYQRLWGTIVVGPASRDDDKTYHVRVTFQRIVWNERDEIARLQSLDEPEMYQRFFSLLSKSILLEGQEI